MEENSTYSDGQKIVKVARIAKSAVKIIKAAVSSGFYGAIVAAVKEALPVLLKVVLWIIVIVLVLLLTVVYAIPNIFFGFGNYGSADITGMTTRALELGGTYIDLDKYESARVDAVVTRLVDELEESGTQIDRVEVEHTFTQDDLIWVIAINSAACNQDLNAISEEDIHAFIRKNMPYTSDVALGAEAENILYVRFDRLSPSRVMDRMGFDEDHKAWASAIHMTLSENDSLDLLASHFEPHIPGYEEDVFEPSDYQYGGEYKNDIDISRFVSPHTKNNLDLASYAIAAWENGWGYVWGTYGNVLTDSLLKYKVEQYPDGVGNYEAFIRNHWLGRRTTDCVGLIKGYGWLDTDTMKICYGSNGMPDCGANSMYRAAVGAGVEGRDYGSIDTMPEIPGLALWMSGHIGVYIGNGYAIEATNTQTGVIKTAVSGRGWSCWCKIPYISYWRN